MAKKTAQQKKAPKPEIYVKMKDPGGSFHDVGQGAGCSGHKPAKLKRTMMVSTFLQAGGIVEISKKEYDELLELFENANQEQARANIASQDKAQAAKVATLEKVGGTEDTDDKGKKDTDPPKQRQLTADEALIFNQAIDAKIIVKDEDGYKMKDTLIAADKWGVNALFADTEFVDALKEALKPATED